MSVLDIDHSQHRSPANSLVHTMAGLVAYHFYDGKPSVFIKPVKSYSRIHVNNTLLR
nr:hypothetical protein [Spirosoma spitsbergense]